MSQSDHPTTATESIGGSDLSESTKDVLRELDEAIEKLENERKAEQERIKAHRLDRFLERFAF